MAQLQNATRLLEVNWLEVPAESSLAGQTIETADVRSQTGASIVGVLRDGELVPNPALTYRFAAGDLVAVMGSGDQLASFQALTADNIGPVDAFDMANSTI